MLFSSISSFLTLGSNKTIVECFNTTHLEPFATEANEIISDDAFEVLWLRETSFRYLAPVHPVFLPVRYVGLNAVKSSPVEHCEDGGPLVLDHTSAETNYHLLLFTS